MIIQETETVLIGRKFASWSLISMKPTRRYLHSAAAARSILLFTSRTFIFTLTPHRLQIPIGPWRLE